MRARAAAGAGALGLLAGLLAPSGASADDRALVRAHGLYPAAEAAAARAGGPQETQAAYDAARELQEALRRATPVSRSCRPLLSALARYAASRVRQMEGIDRPSPSDTASGRRAAERARSQLGDARAGCRGARGGFHAAPAPMSPTSGEAFFGTIVARAPRGADTAQVYDGRSPGPRVRVRGGRARFTARWSPGPHDVRVVFSSAGRVVGGSSARRAWLLPRSAQRAVAGSRSDPGLARALARGLAGGPRFRAAWVQDLSDGRTAGMNAGALFPAASTVKLGLLAGALRRSGSRPEESPYAYDLKAMATWSSNLANNRLLRRMGGVAVAADGLRRLGARQSTFTGEYIVGTELQPGLPPARPGAGPPRVSSRVTSAQDLGRMLYALHASAVSAQARRETGLTAHQARLALGWLLASQQRGDNLSLLAGGTPGWPIAQKNGWITSTRLGAGIIYADRGPAIAVVAMHDEAGISLSSARSVGARVAQAAVGR